ncbi:hypothetical protein ABG807_06510 [Streptococcus iniae]
MTKNKKKTENQPVNLSEWQKRNIEFLEKKDFKKKRKKNEEKNFFLKKS